MLPLALHTLPSLFALLPPELPTPEDAAIAAEALPAARLEHGDDAVWVTVDGSRIFVAWREDADFEPLLDERLVGEAAASHSDEMLRDTWSSSLPEPRGWITPRDAAGAAGGASIRVGWLDASTLLLVDLDGATATVTRGSHLLESWAAAEPLEASMLEAATLAPCSPTGRWPARDQDRVHWIAWPTCARWVRCAPLRLSPTRRRPTGIRVSLGLRAALTSVSAFTAQTMDAGEGVLPMASGTASLANQHPLANDRRAAGQITLTLTVRFDPRAAARERLAASIARRGELTPIDADVADTLGAEQAQAIVCGGRP